VLYLNDHDVNFKGGLFHFADDAGKSEQTVVPKAGRLVLFSSGRENSHFVDEITQGERYTFTMWFSLDLNFKEDCSIISFLNAHMQVKLSSVPSQSDTKESSSTGTEIWDLLKYKQEKYCLSLVDDQGLFACCRCALPAQIKNIHDAIDFCSFCCWKTNSTHVSNIFFHAGASCSLSELFGQWTEYKSNLESNFHDNVRSWKEVDVLYL